MITILCAGSRGDFQPYIALAQQLKKMGKEVRITAGKSNASLVRSYGIDVYPIEADIETLKIDPNLLQAAGSADNPLKMLLAFNKMKEYGVYMVSDFYAACEGSELVVYHPGCSIGYFAAQKLGIPSVLASPFPMHKTGEYLSVVMYGKTKPAPLTMRLSYTLLQGMLWMASKESVKSFWKKRFGTMPENFGCPFERHTDQSHPAVISCSSSVFARPADWNENIHQLGYWFADEPTEYVPSSELSAFLQAGDKPVYIGFGSMIALGKHGQLADIAVEAIIKSGKRGIISGMGRPAGLPASVIALDSIPHSWLFDRVAAVCHHGGAGTTAAGFRAGVPSIIIPFSNDQFAWAHRSYHLGVGAAPLAKKNLTSDKLAGAIRFALSEPVVANAKALGAKIAAENGAEECARIIKKCLGP